MSYKSLKQHMNEALFETRYAPGEIVNFYPRGEHLQKYGIGLRIVIVGIIKQVKIDSERQFYDIQTEDGRFFDGIHEDEVFQDINKLINK